MDDEEDNGGYCEGDRDNSDYQRDHAQGQVNLAESGDNDSPIELELDEDDGRNNDGEVEAYLVNHRVADEYHDAERAGDCDVFKTFDRTNLAKNGTTKRRDRSADSGKVWGPGNEFKSPRKKRFRGNDRKHRASDRLARIAETAGAYLAGDYDRRKEWLVPGRKTRMFRMRGRCSL